jgi:hypothetical protein
MQEEIDRVIIKSEPDYCQLIIPTRKDRAAIYFSGFIIIFTSGIIIAGAIHLLFGNNKNDDSDFIIFCLPLVFILLSLPTFIWNAFGKEIITIKELSLVIERYGMFFEKKEYKLHSIKNLRSDFDNYEDNKWTSKHFGRIRWNFSI